MRYSTKYWGQNTSYTPQSRILIPSRLNACYDQNRFIDLIFSDLIFSNLILPGEKRVHRKVRAFYGTDKKEGSLMEDYECMIEFECRMYPKRAFWSGTNPRKERRNFQSFEQVKASILSGQLPPWFPQHFDLSSFLTLREMKDLILTFSFKIRFSFSYIFSLLSFFILLSFMLFFFLPFYFSSFHFLFFSFPFLPFYAHFVLISLQIWS